MGRAKLELDRENHIISFKTKFLNISYGCSPLIQSILSVDDYDCGYMVIQTNIGEEYIDLIGMLEIDGYTSSYIAYAEQLLGNVELEKIELFG